MESNTPAPQPQPAAQPATPAPAPAAASEQPATITYDDFVKVQLKVATILEASSMEKSKKLVRLQVDLGNGERRQVLAGIKEYYTPEQLVGKQIILVANLAPRAMMGEMSHGMLLAATDAATGKVIIMAPSEPVAPGSGVK
jgi:methionyl-tRNA synthetase